VADCFLCKRLTEAATAAEKRAEEAERRTADAKAELARVREQHRQIRKARAAAIVNALRSLLGARPFLVMPHVAPSPRAPAAPALDVSRRMALVELE
jgi:hypothetical protein